MMTITEVTVSAGRTFNHPYESYSNLRPGVVLRATLNIADDPEVCVKQLQAQAETLVEDHKQHLLSSLHRLQELGLMEQEMTRLESLIQQSQERLSTLRERKQLGEALSG
jgi:hypothetical protein